MEISYSASPMRSVKKCVGDVRWIALIGILVSIYLLLLHFNYGQLGSACEVGSMFSCSVLLIEQYSLWFHIPVPIFSIIFYMITFGLAQYAYKNEHNDLVRPYVYLDLLSFLALGATLFMAWVAFFKLKTICIFCTALYIVSILFFLWIWKIRKKRFDDWVGVFFSELFSFYKRPAVLKVLAGSMVVLAGSYFVVDAVKNSQVKGLDSTAATIGRSIGNPNASLKLDVFSDFQCPSCRMVIPFLDDLEKKYNNEILITYRFYPLDKACNKNIQRDFHSQACQAAKAALCASLQNQFWGYHDYLFQNQSRLNDQIYNTIAKEKGLDLTEFIKCMQSKEADAVIQDDLQAGEENKIQGTPSIFVNGKLYKGKRDVEDFDAFVQSLE